MSFFNLTGCVCSIVQMGCYGIGVSRILAAALEYGCAYQSDRLVWPHAIAPYPICIAPMTQVHMLIAILLGSAVIVFYGE